MAAAMPRPKPAKLTWFAVTPRRATNAPTGSRMRSTSGLRRASNTGSARARGENRLARHHGLARPDGRFAASWHEQFGQATNARHAKRCSGGEELAGTMAADKLARGDAADLDQQVHLPVLALDGDFTAFIVAPCERDVIEVAKQPRDQKIVGYTPGNGAALQMRVGETGADCNPVARSHAGAGRRVCFCIRDLDDDAVRRRQNRPRDIRDAPDRHTQRMAKPDQKSQRKTAKRQRD